MKRALALTLLAACTNTDVVAIDQGAGPDGGDVPPYCRGDGPPVLVGDGITVGDLAKAVIATLVAGAVHRGYPGLLPHRRPVGQLERETARPH